MQLRDKWRSVWSVQSISPPVALRFPLRLDNSSQKQFKSKGARIFGTAKTHCSAFSNNNASVELYTAVHGATMQRVRDGLGRCVKSAKDDGAFSRTQPSIAFSNYAIFSYQFAFIWSFVQYKKPTFAFSSLIGVEKETSVSVSWSTCRVRKEEERVELHWQRWGGDEK